MAALGRGGATLWTSLDGGSADFSPVATANGVVYSVNQSGMLSARDAKTGIVVRRIDLGAPTFGGISTTGRAVYVAVGLGPPPAPAPQGTGPGAIVALGDPSRADSDPDAHGRARQSAADRSQGDRTGVR